MIHQYRDLLILTKGEGIMESKTTIISELEKSIMKLPNDNSNYWDKQNYLLDRDRVLSVISDAKDRLEKDYMSKIKIIEILDDEINTKEAHLLHAHNSNEEVLQNEIFCLKRVKEKFESLM